MNDRSDNPKPAEFAAAFAIAKEALQFVGKFQTPPTPKIYEVWYRYAEGNNDAIKEQLSHAVDEAGEVSAEMIEQLYDQFCTSSDDVDARISRELSDEMADLESLIASQLTAGNEFRDSIDSASDKLGTDATSDEIQTCIAGLIASNTKMQSQLEESSSRLQESQSQVSELRNDLAESQKSVMTDPLTGVGNRRFFETMMIQSLDAIAERGERAFLLLIDLDEFKQVNDNFGHDAGDHVLRFVATETQNICPAGSIARYGGDEFAMFLCGESADEASQIADEIRRFFSTNSLTFAQTGQMLGRIGLSIGVARLRPDDDRESWFRRADQLLYRAKESGRNCVMVERALDR